jgi:hypothetical protein
MLLLPIVRITEDGLVVSASDITFIATYLKIFTSPSSFRGSRDYFFGLFFIVFLLFFGPGGRRPSLQGSLHRHRLFEGHVTGNNLALPTFFQKIMFSLLVRGLCHGSAKGRNCRVQSSCLPEVVYIKKFKKKSVSIAFFEAFFAVVPKGLTARSKIHVSLK